MTRALGYQYDLGSVVVPVADTEVALTGLRSHLKNYESATFVIYYGAVSAGTDAPVIKLQQHTAATSGTSADLAVITEAWIKFETTLDNDETWTRIPQAAATSVTLTGATYAATQLILVIEVDAAQLSDGYEWVSIDQADPGSGGTRPGGILVILNKPSYASRPDSLLNPNT